MSTETPTTEPATEPAATDFFPATDAPPAPTPDPVGAGAPGVDDHLESASDAGEPADDDADTRVGKLRKEAAGYRRQLREAEAERDRLAEILGRRDRTAVEQSALEAGMHDPADLWIGTELDSLRGEDGELDADAVSARLESLRVERPHWFARPGDGLPGDVPRGSTSVAQDPPAPSFGDALTRARRRA